MDDAYDDDLNGSKRFIATSVVVRLVDGSEWYKMGVVEFVYSSKSSRSE